MGVRLPLADSLGNGVRACDGVGHQHDQVGRLALLINARRSRVATAGKTTARSRMEPSVNRGGGLLRLVRSGRALVFNCDFRLHSCVALLTSGRPLAEQAGRAGRDHPCPLRVIVDGFEMSRGVTVAR